jgi:hypothetical protein
MRLPVRLIQGEPRLSLENRWIGPAVAPRTLVGFSQPMKARRTQCGPWRHREFPAVLVVGELGRRGWMHRTSTLRHCRVWRLDQRKRESAVLVRQAYVRGEVRSAWNAAALGPLREPLGSWPTPNLSSCLRPRQHTRRGSRPRLEMRSPPLGGTMKNKTPRHTPTLIHRSAGEHHE